jgi:hypothetical protein
VSRAPHHGRLDKPNPDHDLCPMARGRGLSRSEQKPISVLRSTRPPDGSRNPLTGPTRDQIQATRHRREIPTITMITRTKSKRRRPARRTGDRARTGRKLAAGARHAPAAHPCMSRLAKCFPTDLAPSPVGPRMACPWAFRLTSRGKGRRRAPGDNEFGGKRGVTFVPILRPAVFKLQIPAFDIPPLMQPLAQALDRRPPLIRKHCNAYGFCHRLLRARRERPRNRPAAEG